jgi:Ca2+/H+ antiporter
MLLPLYEWYQTIQRLLIVVTCASIGLYGTALCASMKDHELTIGLLPECDRFHRTSAQACAITWLDIDMTTP